MAKTFTYKRKAISGDCGMQACCANCDLMDLFVSQKEMNAFSKGGSKEAFKDVYGNIIGTKEDRIKAFCTLNGASVRPDNSCDNHVWAKDAWVSPDEEMTLC